MVGQRAADGHHAVQFGGCGGLYAHDHAAVIQQQLVADAAILDQVRVVDADDLLGAFGQRMAGGESELVTDLQFDALVGELSDADLRALQVTEDGDEATMLGGQVADQLGTSLVFGRSAVGEVQTGDIHASENQLFENFRRVTGRAKGGDDFGTTNGHARTPEFKRNERLLCSEVVVIVRLHYLSVCLFRTTTLKIFANESIHCTRQERPPCDSYSLLPWPSVLSAVLVGRWTII